MTQPALLPPDRGASDSLFDSIAVLLPAEQRQHYYRRMAHLRHLEPNDDMLHIAEAMGFLALITRDTPVEIAAERAKMQALLRDGVAEIAKSVNPEAIAESLRKQFDEAGLRDTAALLTSRAAELSSACSEFEATIYRLSDPDTGVTHCITRSLSLMQSELANASSHVRILAGNLRTELCSAITVIAVVSLFLGFLLGVLYARWFHVF